MEVSHPAAEEFRRVVRDRIAAQADAFRGFMRLLAATKPPKDATRIFIALYSDDLTEGFPAVVAYVTAMETETRTTDGIERLQSRLSSFAPLIERDALVALSLWEQDQNGHPLMALHQPYDDVDAIHEFVLPALMDAAANADMSALPIPVQAGVADRPGEVITLYRPAPPEQPGFFKRMFNRT